MPASKKAALAIPQDELGAAEGGRREFAASSDLIMTTDQSRTAFASMLASLISAGDLVRLSVAEFDLLVAKLAGEVMSNAEIHEILKTRALEAYREIRQTP